MVSQCEVFISYRRRDSAPTSQWLARELRAAYGEDCVFIDVENIRTGEAWPERIESQLKSASVVILVIGNQWLTTYSGAGNHRTDFADDWVFREIRMALEEAKTIVPVLIEDAKLPAKDVLEPSMAPLLTREAFRIERNKMTAGMADLVKEVGRLIGKSAINPDIARPVPMLEIPPLDERTEQKFLRRFPTWEISSRVGDKGRSMRELTRRFVFQNFGDAIHFINTASRYIEQIDHHPDWTNTWRTLTVRLCSWDIGYKPSQLDVDVAEYLEELFQNYRKEIRQKDIKRVRPAR